MASLRHLTWLAFVLAACDPAPSTSTSETAGATPEDAVPSDGNASGATPDSSTSNGGGSDAGTPKKDAGAKDGAADASAPCTTCASELVAYDPQNSVLYGVAWHIAVDGSSV